MTTSLLSSLKVTARPEDGSKNPLVQRREKLLTKLGQQKILALALIENEPHTFYREKWVKDDETGEKKKIKVAKKVSPWFYKRNNCYYLEVRNGNKPLELQKGMHAIEVGEEEKLVDTIETIIEAVVAGEVDTLLTKSNKPGTKNEKSKK
ncbi:DUF6641 family protein [Shewanella sp. 6_MG-2023]|uniref:DUF6641 family protein n=1 Tax=Shewanella sp. 6_MG-2023 TaxID=3062660 RepID=UPI0026E1BC17|nr:DUF6641 family protein [Shewanella sp. 6_MG-2023]MDO6620235.1 hypothetical protein [Shewanella sp. 6_MG-2023]